MAIHKHRVLFIGEGATLAHVARPLVLARDLDVDRFEIALARPRTFEWMTADASFPVTDLWSQDPSIFARRLERGLPLYDYPTLVRYVEDDLALIDAIKPDVIVGDFRLSLSVSARLRATPYITICDAYWSPELPLHPPLPVLGFTRFTPLPVAEIAFQCVSGLAMRLHAIPLERLRRRHGLPSLGYNLQHCYTDADLRLFANFPELFPDVRPNPRTAFIGPLAWSPAPTRELDFLDHTEPLVYVTMGSSGDPGVLKTLVPILERTGSRVVIATAGKPVPTELSMGTTRIFDYLPGDHVCRHAKLVICNGGSPTTNQALKCGVPVLGIPLNMDQFLNMRAIQQFGAGILVRADRADRTRLQEAIAALTTAPRFQMRASILANAAQPDHPGEALADQIDRLLARQAYSRDATPR